MSNKLSFEVGSLVEFRYRQWVVLPHQNPLVLRLQPIDSGERDAIEVLTPMLSAQFPRYQPKVAQFRRPNPKELGNMHDAMLLYDAAKLVIRSGAGAFRCVGKLSFIPRPYQFVPLVMALRMETVRLLVADDVGIGKTIEALLIARELIERGRITRFAVICPPHLCEQWKTEIESKIGSEATIIRSGTISALERTLFGDESVFSAFPIIIVSIDLAKGDKYMHQLKVHCPELVIVDEAHQAARPEHASPLEQLRHNLVRNLAEKASRHLVLLTATPHSGKEGEFKSLLGLLDARFASETFDIASDTTIRSHVVQRRRRDVSHWFQEEQFPARREENVKYNLSAEFKDIFTNVIRITRKSLEKWKDAKGAELVKARGAHWRAQSLMLSMASSPEQGAAALRTRAAKASLASNEDVDDSLVLVNPIEDDGVSMSEIGADPGHGTQEVAEPIPELAPLAARLEKLKGLEKDEKLKTLYRVLQPWVTDKRGVVIFCRFVKTADYVYEHLQKSFDDTNLGQTVEIARVNGTMADEERRAKIAELRRAAVSQGKARILVATDCLSEGVNLQDVFSAMVHYDLPWNPNRLEQRVGRIDRFGQTAKAVDVVTLYSDGNPIEAMIMRVLINKARDIRQQAGYTVPFADNSQEIFDAIFKGFVEWKKEQMKIEEIGEVVEAELRVAAALEKSAQTEEAFRNLFAQQSITPDDLRQDMLLMRHSISNNNELFDFLGRAIGKYGGSLVPAAKGHKIKVQTMGSAFRELLPDPKLGEVKVSGASPTPEGYYYLGRNHPFVDAISRQVLADAMRPIRPGESDTIRRCSAMRTTSVTIRTRIVLARLRHVLLEEDRRILNEEVVMIGWEGSGESLVWLDDERCRQIMTSAPDFAAGNMSVSESEDHIAKALRYVGSPEWVQHVRELRQQRGELLRAAHCRFLHESLRKRVRVANEQPHEDLIGIYVFIPVQSGGQAHV